MNQAFVQWMLTGGLGTVVGGVVWALINRRKMSADTAKVMNQATQIASDAIDKRMQNLREELYDAMGLSDARRSAMSRMDRAISIMRIRMERHGTWDCKMKSTVQNLQEEVRKLGGTVDVNIDDPPTLDFSDIDFDFSIHPVRNGSR